MKAVAIIPAFNEARNLPRLFADLKARAPEVDLCVVDDGSSDDTAQVARAHGATVLRLPVNLGIGGAVQTGYLWAAKCGYEVAIQLDGDGQHDPSYLLDLIRVVSSGEADLAIGSRFLQTEGFRSTLVRRAGIRYLSLFLRLRCGARLTDPTSGFRAAGRRAIELFCAAYPADYPEPESIAVALKRGLSVREIPVTMQAREHGQSSINWLRTLYYLVKVTLALTFIPRPRAQLASRATESRS